MTILGGLDEFTVKFFGPKVNQLGSGQELRNFRITMRKGKVER